MKAEERVEWYAHFWPWFLVILLGLSVLASIATVRIAFGLGDLEVHEAVQAVEGRTAS